MIPPAWRDVWISPRANAKLQATGVDSAGRRQYLYHPDFRAQQEQAKFDKLVRFAERAARIFARRWPSTWTRDPDDRERVCAVAVRLINLGWFRVGSDRYAEDVADVRDHDADQAARLRAREPDRVPLPRQAQRPGANDARRRRSSRTRVKELLAQPGGARLFRYGRNGESCTLTGAVLNDYIQEYLGEEFTAKDFRTWGGTLTAAIALAERGVVETETEAKRVVADVMRTVGENGSEIRPPLRARRTSARPSSSSISTGERSTIFGRGICASSAPAISGSNQEEQALVSLLRSWRIRRARQAA